MFKRRTVQTALVAVISLLVFANPVIANPGNGNGNGNGNGGGSGSHGNSGNGGNSSHGNSDNGNHENKGQSSEKSSDVNSSHKNYGHPDNVNADISVSRARSLAVNYGLVGYQALPPGIAKNLVRGKPLPPGIAKKTVPASMIGQLPYYPGYEWRVVGSDLVLIALSTAVVTAILDGVFD